MTKKEIAMVEDLKAQLRIARAFRWTEPVEPDVDIPNSYNELAKGFLYNAFSLRVEKSCSSSVGHSFGLDDVTGSQRGVRLYSTRKLALMAMRHDKEKMCAAELAIIDAMIEAETEAS